MFVGRVLPSLRHRWGYECSFDAKRPNSGGFVGLKNQGCTCYMNSLLQQVSLYHRQERVSGRGGGACGGRSYRFARNPLRNGLVQFSTEGDALYNQGRMAELKDKNSGFVNQYINFLSRALYETSACNTYDTDVVGFRHNAVFTSLNSSAFLWSHAIENTPHYSLPLAAVHGTGAPQGHS